MEYTISKHEATGRLYAYYKGVFWFWDEHVQKWLLSQFAEDLYQERRKSEKNFTREDLLSETADFYLLDGYEVDYSCIAALLQCNPKTAIPAPASAESPEIVDECSEPNCTCSDCKRQDCTCAGGCDAGDRGKCDGEKNCAQDGCTYTAKHQENPTPAAPVSPVDAGAATQSLSDAAPASLAAAPTDSMSTSSQAFDYSGMDVSTVDTLRWAELEIREARRDYISRLAQAVYIAHNTLCATVVQNLDTGKFVKPEDTFQRWCESVGIKRSTAYNLLQVQALLSGAAPEEQATLEAASPSLLYAAAKPSAPAELVQAVKDGDITTHKQYQEALAEIKARDAKIQELLEMSENSDRRADEAEAKAKKAEQERDAARDAQANLSAMANKFSKQRDAAEQRVEDAEHRAEEAERRAQAAEAEVKSWEADGQKMQEIVDDQQAVIEEQKARIGELESGITVETTAADQEEIERRANELSEPLVKIINQQNEEIQQLAAGNTVSAQASVLEHYLKTMEASLLSNAQRAELASYDIGALDSLARALREFADSIDGIFEDRSEDND